VCALDYQFDITATGRTLKLLHVIDEYSHGCLADLVFTGELREPGLDGVTTADDSAGGNMRTG